MATVNLRRVWISLASDLTQTVVAGSSGRADTRSTAGKPRLYAGGRVRNITQAGTMRVFDLTLVDVPFATALQLEAWLDQLVLFRDKMGRRHWGTYSQVKIGNRQGQPTSGPACDVTLASFTEVSHSEAV